MQRSANSTAVRASLILISLLMAAGLTACGKTETAASLMAEAQRYEQSGDNKAALIQLKNAVAKNPEDAEARARLASLYNVMGDPLSAEKEIRKAASLGVASARTAPQLAKALLAQGQAQKALDESAAAAAGGDPDLLAIRGEAWLALREHDKAKQSFTQALAAKPGQAEALIGLARLAMANNDPAAATVLMDQATSANPKSAKVFYFKGMLLRTQNRPAEALAALSQAITLQPDFVAARLERANFEIGTRQFDAAKADLEAARKSAPGGLQLTYNQALLDFSQDNAAAAQSGLQKILGAAPDYPPALLLSAAVELKLRALQQAEQHARRYLELDPGNAYARKLLAQIQLNGKEPELAAATLAPLLQAGSQDSQLLALAGESSLRRREFGKASEYFARASALAPDTASLHTQLGIAKLAQGDQAGGLSELERATALDPKSQQSGVALVRTEIALKHFDKALKATDAMLAVTPNDAEVHNLKGGVLMGMGDRTGARASFAKAAELKPTLLAAQANLAQLDLQDKRPTDARKRFETVLAGDKKNIGAMNALAELAGREGKAAEAIGWFERASAENPEALAPAIKLGAIYLQANEPAKALAIARKYQTSNPTNPELLDLLGQAQMATKDAPGALETYGKLASVAPKSPGVQYRLAVIHMALKNQAAASEDLKRALALQPDFQPAQVAQVQLAMMNKRYDDALSIARAMEKQKGHEAAGYALEGDVLMAQQKNAAALAAYEKSYALGQAPQLLVPLHRAMQLTGKEKEADARLVQWIGAHPEDARTASYLAESYMARKQIPAAAALFEAMLKRTPNNPGLLNNLAWCYQQVNDPRALATAELALKAAPDLPAVMDTAGWILLQQGNSARALPLLQKAAAQAPASTAIQYHLAVALQKTGDKKGAKIAAEKLLSNNKEFPEMDDTKALLKVL